MTAPSAESPTDRAIHLAAGWLGLAIVLLALVEIAPASNRFVVWTLGLVALYLLLTNAPKTALLSASFVSRLAGNGPVH